MNIFDGLYGYEKLMLICGFVLFLFALAAITVLIVKNRDFKAAMGLFVFAILLMGFPGIQAVKISQDMVELDNIRQQPQAPASPAQQQQAQALLANLEERAAGNPQLQAKVSDGYRAIGEVDKGYQLAQSVLQQHPSPQVRATLVPVLTAQLNRLQAGAQAAVRPTASPAPVGGAAARGNTAEPPPAPAAAHPDQQREIAAVASQLQGIGTPLPATSRIALANAYVALGQPSQARANVEAAQKANPQIKISPALSHAIQGGGIAPAGH
ncbi:MAG TPA: hypothetical protein VF415_07760 [Rhodanobacter sp.]